MTAKHNRITGFTLVELLIVIVIIAILSAITIVAYNGIQNRANDSAVQNDLSSIAQKLEMYKVDNASGLYPTYADFNGFAAAQGISVAKGSYLTSGLSNNLLNCTVASGTGGTSYAILATSKSGNKFWISSNSGGVKQDTSTNDFGNNATCPLMLAGSVSAGSGWNGGTWRW